MHKWVKSGKVSATKGTDSYKKASRFANRWADELWSQIGKARSSDWDYHNIKDAVVQHHADGLSDDEIDDIAFQTLYDKPEKYDAYERATNKTVVLNDHLENYFQWCMDKDNSSKTLESKRTNIGQFCLHFSCSRPQK